MFGALGAMLLGGLGGFVAYFYPKQGGAFGGKITVPDNVATVASLKANPDVYQVRVGKFYLSVFNADDPIPGTHPPVAGQGKLAVMALYWKCKHLGCTVPWKPDEDYSSYHGGIFHCPCHGSIYTRSGQNVGGPAPAPLDYMAISFDGNKIVVDTGKRTTRVQYDKNQPTPLPG
jgi:cytochrome b6-f complex iron-sulfur subunit